MTARKPVRVRNVSPRGDLEVPSLRAVVPAGDVIEVPAAAADALLEQPDNWQEAVTAGKDEK